MSDRAHELLSFTRGEIEAALHAAALAGTRAALEHLNAVLFARDAEAARLLAQEKADREAERVARVARGAEAVRAAIESEAGRSPLPGALLRRLQAAGWVLEERFEQTGGEHWVNTARTEHGIWHLRVNRSGESRLGHSSEDSHRTVTLSGLERALRRRKLID